MPPAQGMALKLKRSQKQSTLGAVIYVLDARMGISADVRQYIYTHRLAPGWCTKAKHANNTEPTRWSVPPVPLMQQAV
jgi:hypothetical protein